MLPAVSRLDRSWTFGAWPLPLPRCIIPGVEARHHRDLPTTLVCIECRRHYKRERGWRTYLSDDEPAQLLVYCPDCADREFGDAYQRPPIARPRCDLPAAFVCVECGRRDDGERGWVGCRLDIEHEPPELAFFCPRCARREFRTI